MVGRFFPPGCPSSVAAFCGGWRSPTLRQARRPTATTRRGLLSPLRGLGFVTEVPRLTPWATFYRTSGADSRRAKHGSSVGRRMTRLRPDRCLAELLQKTFNAKTQTKERGQPCPRIARASVGTRGQGCPRSGKIFAERIQALLDWRAPAPQVAPLNSQPSKCPGCGQVMVLIGSVARKPP